MKFTYLLIDLSTLIIPFLFSFHPKLNFYKTWGSLFPALIITTIPFIIWDAYFSNLGVWGFNQQYLIGSTIFNLPIEEVFFFFCIPYACVFTFHCLSKIIKPKIRVKYELYITTLFIFVLILIGLFNYQQIYTTVTFLGLSILLVTARFLLRVNWLAQFYIIYAILLLPFLVVNGILTGSWLVNPVVWYNETEIMGVRLFTMPVEDAFYGMELILMNLLIYCHLEERKSLPVKRVILDS